MPLEAILMQGLSEMNEIDRSPGLLILMKWNVWRVVHRPRSMAGTGCASGIELPSYTQLPLFKEKYHAVQRQACTRRGACLHGDC